MIIPALLYAVTFLDQLTKWMVQRNLRYGQSISLIPGMLNLRYVRNTGAAWGILSNAQILLIVIAAVVLGFLWARGRRIFGETCLGQWTQGLMMAGICGNLIDRIRLGFVVDFVDFYHGTWHFPAFNVADVAICSGVGLYFLAHFRWSRNPDSAADSTDHSG